MHEYNQLTFTTLLFFSVSTHKINAQVTHIHRAKSVWAYISGGDDLCISTLHGSQEVRIWLTFSAGYTPLIETMYNCTVSHY